MRQAVLEREISIAHSSSIKIGIAIAIRWLMRSFHFIAGHLDHDPDFDPENDIESDYDMAILTFEKLRMLGAHADVSVCFVFQAC
ncbi:hypothetical protein JXA32_16750 [Candidatus Sumerlaeota bacterium]|nr:hypothetical protein [Candidatus Sumerlaeota bacterium]